jgi:hypothetical protein
VSSNPGDPFQPTARDPFQQNPSDPARDPFGPVGGPPAAAPSAPPITPGTTIPVQPLAVAPRRGAGGMLVNVLLGVALVVAVGGVAFAVGRATAPVASATTARNGFGGQGGNGGTFAGPGASGAPGRGFGPGGGFGGVGGFSIQGTVEAIDATSLTIKLASGQTVTIGLNGTTTYHKQAPATASDVTTGSTVLVQLDGRGFGAGARPQASGAPEASGAPTAAGLGAARTVTVVPAGS